MIVSLDIDKVREHANDLLSFKYERRTAEQWSKFWGCIDSLRDVEGGIHSLIRIDRKPTYLECIGFLQALVIQQDAIYHIGKTVGMSWKPSDETVLKKIRNVRNKVSAHSAWASHEGESTSMINSHDIRKDGFKAVVYSDENLSNASDLYTEVVFLDFINDNVETLSRQIERIILKMTTIEDSFKVMMNKIDWSLFDDGSFTYLLEKLWSPWRNNRVSQAQSHVKILEQKISVARSLKEENNLPEIDEYSLSMCEFGINELQLILNEPQSQLIEKRYDLVLYGWRRFFDELVESFDGLKKMISE